MRKSNLLAAASISVLAASSAASAQDQSAPGVETVVVSGSLIARPGFNQPTPVSVVNAQDLMTQAPTQIADALNELPQFGLPTSPTAGWEGASTGEAADTVNLRNLGATRTLVLLNGERIVPFSTVNTIDMSMLPSALVKRVDVVTGGASAAYGSDAVAGVVNVILDDQYVGLKGSLQYGNTSDLEYETYKGDLTYGTTLDADRIHLIGSVSYSDSPQSLYADSRDWYGKNGSSAIVNNPAYSATNGQPKMIHVGDVGLCGATQGGIITSGPLKNTQFVGNGQPVAFNPGTVDQNGILCYGGQASGFAQDGALVGETQLTYNAYGYASYQITDDIKAHLEVDYGHSGGFSTNYPDVHNGNITLQTSNPYVPASVQAALTAAGQTSFTFGTTNQNITLPQFDSNQYGAFRNQERVAIGFDGKLGDDWTWTAHYGHGETHLLALFPNNPNETNLALAENAVIAPAGNSAGLPAGSIVCASTLTNPTNGCVPIDLFGFRAASQSAMNYVEPYNFYNLVNRQDDAQVSIQGEPLSDWAGPISVAGGLDWRSSSADGFSDPLSYLKQFYSGDNSAFHGAQNVYEGFGEIVAPLVKDSSWSKAIDLDAAGRVTDYSTSGVVETWKLGLTDQITDEYRLRGSWSYDIRAPNLNELFNAGSIGTRAEADPFTGTKPTIQFVTTGNPNLKPEIGTTFSGGIVMSPNWIDGLTASFDWYSINIKKAIASVPDALLYCSQGFTVYCPLVIRNGPAVPGTGLNQVSQVLSYPLNTAQATNSGLDFELDYNTSLFDGDLNLHGTGNYTDEATSVSNGVILDNAGSLGNDTLGGGVPKFKFVLSATYKEGPFSQTIQTRLWGAALYDAAYAPGYVDNNDIPAVAYLDLRGSYDLNYMKSFQVYYAIDNVLGTPPPWIPSIDSASGAPYYLPTRAGIYDAIGRVFRIGIRANAF